MEDSSAGGATFQQSPNKTIRADAVQNIYCHWRGCSRKAVGRPSVLPFGGQRIVSDHWNFFWSELGTWTSTFPDNPVLKVSSHCSHTDTVAYRPVTTVSSEHAPQRDRQMDVLQSNSVAWTLSKVTKSATSMLRRCECSFWKQWSELICGFERDFDRSPCSQQKYLLPLVKKGVVGVIRGQSSEVRPGLIRCFVTWRKCVISLRLKRMHIFFSSLQKSPETPWTFSIWPFLSSPLLYRVCPLWQAACSQSGLFFPKPWLLWNILNSIFLSPTSF